MDRSTSKGNCAPLPLSVLRLMVPPVQLMSAAIWHSIQQKVVSDYGMLEEFVSMVTDIVPDLLTARQKAQLTLGLRAQATLESCQLMTTANLELVEPHLDRMQKLIKAWKTEVAAAEIEASRSEFVDLVRNLLKNPDEREHFFQNVFPEEFGSTYHQALETLMWIFLSRLEEFLPLQSFQQVASMLGEASGVLEECTDSVLQCEEFKLLLQKQKDVSQVDHNDSTFDGASIISALKLPSAERSKRMRAQPHDLNNALSYTTSMDIESLTPPSMITFEAGTIPKDESSEMTVAEANWILEENVPLGAETRLKDSPGLHQSRTLDVSHCMKQCHVRLRRLDPALHSQRRPVRRNRGLRMKMLLLEEKRGMKALTVNKLVPRKIVPSNSSYTIDTLHYTDSEQLSPLEDSYMAPINNCSEDDSWSYYSDVDSSHESASMCSSWSYYSDDQRDVETEASSHTEDDLAPVCSNVDSPIAGPKIVSATGSSPNISNVNATGPKKAKKAKCCICKKHVDTGLRAHMKTHFPTGDYACPQCDGRFKLYSSFKQHLSKTCFEYGQQEADPEKPDKGVTLFKCDRCQEAFLYKIALEKHKVTHNELYCGVCRRVLRDASTLARHKASHTPFQCTRCEQSFTLYKPLHRHYQNVHKLCRPFTCTFCTKTYSRLRILIMHEWKHTGHLPFQCTVCSKRFRNDSDLISHERVHTRERPYLCAECGKTFAHWPSLLRHRRLVHSEFQNEKRHSCSECQKSFKLKEALKKHQRTKHRNELFRQQCLYCGKMLSSSTLSRHELIHKGERPFTCTVPECDRRFRSTYEVKRHVLMRHTNEKPYKCDVCQKGFISQCDLSKHAAIHSGEKPFVCHICRKAFPILYSMRRHIKLKHAFGKR